MATARSVLVTGSSSGIGEATVDLLVRRGFRVWATVRQPADAQRLEERHGEAVTVVHCDVTSATDVAALGERVRADGPLWGLVANAGSAVPSPLETLPLDELRAQLEVNLVGQLAVVQAVLPSLLAARGRVVLIGSIGGRIAGPVLGAYHASKFGLRGLSDSLRAELAPSGVKVVLVEPGAVATRIWGRGRVTGDRLLDHAPAEAVHRYRHQVERVRADAARAAEHGIPPARVAEVVVDALSAPRPRPRRLVGRDAQVAAVIAALPHRLRYRLTAARR